MTRQECVWMCFIICTDKPCLCAISLELLSFLTPKCNLQLTHVQNSKRTTCYSFCNSMSPFEQFQHHHTSGTFVPVAAKKIILPHAHVLQEYLKTPDMLKTPTFVKETIEFTELYTNIWIWCKFVCLSHHCHYLLNLLHLVLHSWSPDYLLEISTMVCPETVWYM